MSSDLFRTIERTGIGLSDTGRVVVVVVVVVSVVDFPGFKNVEKRRAEVKNFPNFYNNGIDIFSQIWENGIREDP